MERIRHAVIIVISFVTGKFIVGLFGKTYIVTGNLVRRIL